MAQPTPQEVHVNAVLSNLSVAYMNRMEAFVSPRAFPVVPVDKQSDLYYTYTKNDWFRDEAQRRPPNTESAGSGYGLSTASYNCDVWALHKDVDNQLLANADAPINLEREATEFVTQRLLLRQERQWTTDYFTTGVWATDATPANLWSNYATSDPIADIKTGRRTILANTGLMANTIIAGWDVFEQLKDHPDIIDRFKYTSSDNITAQLLARLFEVDRFLVCSAIFATNLEGETAAYDFVQGKHLLLCHSAPSPGLLTPSAGYTFMWRGVSQGLGLGIGISDFPMEHLKSQRFEGEVAFDDKVVAADLGYFFNGAVA